jgi:hypothetical protein
MKLFLFVFFLFGFNFIQFTDIAICVDAPFF